MIKTCEVLQEVQDASPGITFEIPPRPCSRPLDVDGKAATRPIAPFAPITLVGLAQEAECCLLHELGPAGVRGEGRELTGCLWLGTI